LFFFPQSRQKEVVAEGRRRKYLLGAARTVHIPRSWV
jgi:hypothetical protein